MGLVREDGTPEQALADFFELHARARYLRAVHYEDHRLDNAAR
jgi:hypothetical protein